MSLEVSGNEVGPVYGSGESADLADIKSDMTILANKIENIEKVIEDKNWIEKREFQTRNSNIEKEFEDLEEKLEKSRVMLDSCEEMSLTNKYAMIGVNNQLQKVL